MIDRESRDLAGAAYLARGADAGPGDDRPTRAEADHEAWLDQLHVEDGEEMPDSWDLPEGRTRALPFCDRCPDLATWSSRSLILGLCPLCGRGVEGERAARILRARRLVQEGEAA